MSAVLTKQDVYRYAQEIVAEAGETYSDEDPYIYFDEDSGQPLCLVAHILHRSGHLTYEAMQEDEGGDLLNSVSFYALCKRLQLPVTADAVEVLQELQYRQDNGTPWADCLAQVQSLDAAGGLAYSTAVTEDSDPAGA